MIVEVSGTNSRNKGAELMLVAIRDHFADRSSVQLCVNQFFGPYEDRARYGLRQKVRIPDWGRSRVAVQLMPEEFRRSFGLVREEDVDVLLDASGFAFGDQHPAGRTTRFARKVERAARAGKAVILLPQAFGPFRQTRIRKGFARIVEHADLVFARDEISKKHAESAAGCRSHLLRAPDFTSLIRPEHSRASADSDRACLVPNQRMLEKADSEEEAAAYVPFMVRCIEVVVEAGLEPALLVHEENDDELAARISRRADPDVPVHETSDPVALKRFLGESHLVVGSRFHALVGSLSLGVPAIGTSWSHKYEMLFDEYGCSDMLLSVWSSEERIRRCVADATDPDSRRALTARIEEQGDRVDREIRRMWDRVDRVIGERATVPQPR